MHKMKAGKEDDDRAEGVREFVRLVGLRFGSGAEEKKESQDVDMMML
jgi:hypothetical protein